MAKESVVAAVFGGGSNDSDGGVNVVGGGSNGSDGGVNVIGGGSNVSDGGPVSSVAGSVSELKLVHEAVFTALVVLVMLALGCQITRSQLVSALRSPPPILAGLAAQFLVMPLTAYGVQRAVTLADPAQALALLLVATCPGGVASNIYTWLADGDLPLSICMTTFSTLFAIGMMPLNLFIYSTAVLDSANPGTGTGQHLGLHVQIPYTKLVLGLVFIIIPVTAGLLLHHHAPKLALWVKRVGGACTVVALVTAVVLQRVVYGEDMLSRVGWRLVLVAALLPALGLLLGYTLATSLSLLPLDSPVTPRAARTIAIETSCQNTVLAIAIASLSFPAGITARMMPFFILYGGMFSVEALLICGSVRVPQLLRMWREHRGRAREGAVDGSLATAEGPAVKLAASNCGKDNEGCLVATTNKH